MTSPMLRQLFVPYDVAIGEACSATTSLLLYSLGHGVGHLAWETSPSRVIMPHLCLPLLQHRPSSESGKRERCGGKHKPSSFAFTLHRIVVTLLRPLPPRVSQVPAPH